MLLEVDLSVEAIEQRPVGNQLKVAVLEDDRQLGDIVPVDSGLLGKRVARRKCQDQTLVPQSFLDERLALQSRSRCNDHEVDRALGELSAQVLRPRFDKPESHLRACGDEIGDASSQRPGNQSWRKAEPELAGAALRGRDSLDHLLIDCVEDHPCGRQDRLPDRRQFQQRAAAALEQVAAIIFFEAGDCLADRRLGSLHKSGGARKRPCIYDLKEDF